MANPFPDILPAESSSVRGDVHAAVGQVGRYGHELVDETGPAHESESADQFVMVSYHAEDVSCGVGAQISTFPATFYTSYLQLS